MGAGAGGLVFPVICSNGLVLKVSQGSLGESIETKYNLRTIAFSYTSHSVLGTEDFNVRFETDLLTTPLRYALCWPPRCIYITCFLDALTGNCM